MAKKITESELLLVSKAKAEKLKNYADGISLSTRSGKTIENLKEQVAKDRMALAKAQLRTAIRAASSNPQLTRTAVSRAYYAMYHAARAITYLAHGGDDHEEHSILPGKLPTNLPNVDSWRNKLKNARLERNKADYDPYPRHENAFAEACETLIADAKEFVRVAQKYIKSI